jgi:hypothetical protein
MIHFSICLFLPFYDARIVTFVEHHNIRFVITYVMKNEKIYKKVASNRDLKGRTALEDTVRRFREWIRGRDFVNGLCLIYFLEGIGFIETYVLHGQDAAFRYNILMVCPINFVLFFTMFYRMKKLAKVRETLSNS